MLFQSRKSPAERARQQALELIEQARESGEDALSSVTQSVERAVRPRVSQAADTVERAVRPRVAQAADTVERAVRPRVAQAADAVESALVPRVAQAADYLGVRKPEPARSSGDDALAFINGLVIGAVLAAIVAYLLAPTDGATLRRRLRAQFDALMGRSSIEDVERDAASAPETIPPAAPPVDQTAVLAGATPAAGTGSTAGA